ncbi:hypothetical protein [Streptomyces sp. KO7888]|uniref:hypothetical protein n=1 Tax=Streptomyces sp. KO7888 TaxID=2602737 RepID=UPI001A996C51|nr:hypothetical protein [Streptomyces sp. KO7888]
MFDVHVVLFVEEVVHGDVDGGCDDGGVEFVCEALGGWVCAGAGLADDHVDVGSGGEGVAVEVLDFCGCFLSVAELVAVADDDEFAAGL